MENVSKIIYDKFNIKILIKAILLPYGRTGVKQRSNCSTRTRVKGQTKVEQGSNKGRTRVKERGEHEGSETKISKRRMNCPLKSN